MTRIDRGRILAARSSVLEVIQTRFDDLDMQGHINNGSTVILLQEARARFNRVVGLPRMTHALRALVAGFQVEFGRELYHPDPVEISTSVISMGRTSFMMGQVLRQNGHDAVFAETTIVLADKNGPTPLPNEIRTAYSAQLDATAEGNL